MFLLELISRFFTGIYNYCYTLFNHRKIIAKWKEEAQKDLSIKLQDFKAHADGFSADIRHPFLFVFVDTCIKVFKGAQGAHNYLALTTMYETEPFEFIIQRKQGKTPADIAGELQKENETLRKKIEEMRQYMDNYCKGL